MVYIARRYVAGHDFRGDSLAAKHGCAKARVVETDARGTRERFVGVGNVAARRLQACGLIVVVGNVFNDPFAYGSDGCSLRVCAAHEFFGFGYARAALIEVAKNAGTQKWRELACERHVGLRAEQLNVIVARGVLHNAERVSAIAEGQRAHDGRAVVWQVVIRAVLAAAYLEFQP